MNVLIVSQYFWPENFKINDIAKGLVEKGHNVSVLTGLPNYPTGKLFKGYSYFKIKKEKLDKITIYRSPLLTRANGSSLRLFLNYFSFAFFASLRVLFINKKFDKIFVYEVSPITVGIPAIIAKYRFKAPIFFWVQDLWPESVSAAGQLNNKIVLKSLNNLTKWIYKNSKLVLIQSEGFREYILNQGVRDSKIVYYPNSTESLYNIVKPKDEISKLIPKVPFSIMFAGNIGESQDFENILEAAKILKDKTNDIHFVVLGNGRKKDFVIQKVEEYKLESNFHLLGAFPVNTMPHFFACADVLLVTLKKSRIFSLTIPSKVQSYLACGKPIIGALDGEGAKVILDSKAGLVAPSGDSKKLANKIFELYHINKQDREKLGENARKYYEEHFEREKLLTKLVDLFKK